MQSLLTPTPHEIEENRALWARNLEEAFLDRRTYFDLIGDDLPEHHFWKRDQNPRVRPKILTALQQGHHTDMTTIPRFHPNGLLKTPLEHCQWHVPLDENGRFDWRANVAKNQHFPPFHVKSWVNASVRRPKGMVFFPWRFNDYQDGTENVLNGFRMGKVDQLPMKTKWERATGAFGRLNYRWGLRIGLFFLVIWKTHAKKSYDDSIQMDSKKHMLKRYRNRASFHDSLV